MSIIILEDKSPNRNNAKLFNYNKSLSLVEDVLNGPPSKSALKCNNREYITVNNKDLEFDINDSFSISAWFKTNCTSGSPILISKVDKLNVGYEIILDATNGKIIFQLINSPVKNHMRIDTIASFNDDIWHNVVVTWDGENKKASIYIDGISQEVSIICNTLSKSIINKSDLQISGKNKSVSLWDGLISDIAVFNQKLSKEKIELYYKAGVSKLNASLVGYWSFTKSPTNKKTQTKHNKVKYYIMSGFDPDKKQYHSWKLDKKPDNDSTDVTYNGKLTDIHISASYIK